MTSCPHCGAELADDAYYCDACKKRREDAPQTSAPQRDLRIGSSIATIFVIVSLLVAGVSILAVSQATFGVWMLAGACLLAIYARMVQAADYHRQLVETIRRR